jgi:drug/metabolite transporter (DMT)-like permease
MIPILGGLGAAAAWAAATLCASRASRMIGSGSTLAWVMLLGLAVTAPLAVATGVPSELDASSAGWLAVLGVGSVLGLGLVYTALRIGKVGIVAPITSTEGAVAAVIAVVAGERIAPGAGAILGVIVVGVVLASVAPDPGGSARRNSRAVALAVGAAILFGVSLYAAGRAGEDLPVAWVLLPSRVVGLLAVVLPLLIAGRLRITARSLPLVVAGALAEVGGLAAFTLGAREGIAISVVIASQYAAFAALAAYVLFRERLSPLQVSGVAAIAGGVAALSALTA